MAATQAPAREQLALPTDEKLRDPAFTAFWVLRVGFTVIPIAAGIDKFFNWMVDWPHYLWSEVTETLPVTAQQFMYGVGVLEIAAGVIVFFAPRLGGILVSAWLAVVTANLLLVATTTGEYFDVAFRDIGLVVSAIALTLLAFKYMKPEHTHEHTSR